MPGSTAISVGLAGLTFDIPTLNVVWYCFAWYGWLLLLDAWISFLGRRSPLERNPGLVLSWFLLSVPFWFLFELYNIRVQNWYYVYAFRNVLTSLVFSVIAFATVIPACFYHAEVVETLLPRRHMKGRAVAVNRGWIHATWVLGLLCLVLPLVFPGTCYWMLWGVLLGLPEWLNYRSGATSFLRDLENGSLTRLSSLLVGGMWAGLVWEGFNYWARCKWIYTVPGMEDWKIFEMPILGFLGFPVLALNARASFDVIDHLAKRRYAVAIVFLFGVSLTVLGHHQMRTFTIRSYRPQLTEFPGSVQNRLEVEGIESVEMLASACRQEAFVKEMREVCETATLSLHKGMGIENARLLVRGGVRNVAELRSVEEVYAAVRPLEPAIRRAEVAVWVRAAGEGGKR